MRWGRVRRAFCASGDQLFGLRMLAIALVAGALAGCASQPGLQLASLETASSNATIAFETIDGPPPDVFERLVAALNEEAGARQIAVVSRSRPAAYRIRGYMSALVEGEKTSFGWVWDLYDNEKHRALRISGEEPAATRGRAAWSGADDQVLHRMARDGMGRIAAFLDSSGSSPAVVAAAPFPTPVSVRDDSPEAAGIFRVFKGGDQPDQTASPAAEDPVPPRRPTVARPRSAAATTTPAIRSAALEARP